VLITCWSAKGGSGTTVVAASLAIVLARTHAEVLLVDLAGDLPGALGVAEPEGPGVAGWCSRAGEAPADALHRLEVPVCDGVNLLPLGAGTAGLGAEREAIDLLAALLAADDRPVVVDAGLASGASEVVVALAARSRSTLLVTRACYLGLRRASDAVLRPTGVVLVDEAERALSAADVEEVLGVPVVASVPWDPAVARAVDAGLLASRLPRRLARALDAAA
jgi:MinD-like ATPase involved in chromosome partitioning or flagellar assembly